MPYLGEVSLISPLYPIYIRIGRIYYSNEPKMSQMNIDVYCGVPGSRKTLSMLAEVASVPNRYVVAVPRKELQAEFAPVIESHQRGGQNTPIVISINSSQKGFREGVVRRIEDALRDNARTDHCAILITHEALLLLDPEKLSGWHVRIDEVPDGAVLTNAFPAAVSFRTLNHCYSLEPTGHDRWFQVIPRVEAENIKPGEYRTDAAETLAAFHKAATNPHRAVFVDVSAWEEARVHGRHIHWWSIWTPTSLRACASVAITGAGFFRSLLYHACHFVHRDRLVFNRVAPTPSAQRAQPHILIHYFARHIGSTTWWATPEGSFCLVRISERLREIAFKGYWSSNKDIKPFFWHRFGGDAVDPRQAGTNALRQHTSCAYFYSNKAQPNEFPFLKLLELDEEVVTVAREREDIIQFVMRGKVRDPSFDGVYDIYLYSEDQAVALRDYLRSEKITDFVEIRAIAEAGVLDIVRPGPNDAGSINNSKEQIISVRDRDERRKAKDRERSQQRRDITKQNSVADGTYRKRGRPKK